MRALREAGLLLIVAAAPAVLAVVFHPELADRQQAGLEDRAVRLTDVRAWRPDALWIDARSAEAFAQDHIPGALHLDEATFAEGLGAVLTVWQPGQRIVVYCSSASCGTSKAVATRLREAGFDEVYFLHGGWEAWQDAAR